uniref:Polynucleotide 5'-hydroxyl-kinase NOL9 n=1 Tax=Cuerna arida TaxID=1464854 RepID=A0A1B6G999_9HEMI
MKIKNSKSVKINQLVSSPILKFKKRKYKVATKRKLKKLVKDKMPNQRWEVTNSVQSTAKCKEENKTVSVISSKNKRHRPKITFHMASTSKTDLENCESNLLGQVSIVKMSSVSMGDVWRTEFYNKHNNNSVTPLKCLMFNAKKDSSSLISDNCLNHNNATRNTVLSVNPDEVQPLNSNEKLTTKKVTIFDVQKSSHEQNMKEYSLEVNSTNEKNTVAKIYELSGFRFLVVMEPECYFYIIGIIELELLKGSLEILGYKFNGQIKKQVIFSPQGSCHLCIKAKNYGDTFLQNSQNISFDQLLQLGLSEEKSRRVLRESETCTLFIINRNRNYLSSYVWPKFFENHHSFSIFPPDDLLNDEERPCHNVELKVDCIFEANLNGIGLKQFVEVSEWSAAVENITLNGCPKSILCGGKSVGKSTLLRYLINKCLQKWSGVLVLDFDLGQCEFTIGGCISAVLLEEPVLGPNYTHLKQPLRSVFLGEIDVTKCPESYIEGCTSLIHFARENYDNIPWLINTMGFTKGFGVKLICDIIKNVKPTHVIEIQSKKRNLNFPMRLDPGFVHNQNIGNCATTIDYKFFIVGSGAEEKGNNSPKARGMSPAEARNLVILAYFSEVLSSEMTSLTQATPYMINMDQINLKITNKYNFTKAQLCATMNGNLVALCILNEGDRFPHCPGFGIIRGIDHRTGVIYMITPLPRETLKQINCLVKGNICLPESLHFSQVNEAVGPIPFLAHTSGKPTSRFAKRDFRKLPMS